jgi:hypothetical protein
VHSNACRSLYLKDPSHGHFYSGIDDPTNIFRRAGVEFWAESGKMADSPLALEAATRRFGD